MSYSEKDGQVILAMSREERKAAYENSALRQLMEATDYS
jgi:hypothetical protein